VRRPQLPSGPQEFAQTESSDDVRQDKSEHQAHQLPGHRGQEALADEGERRERPRYPVSASAEILEPRTNTRLTGRATDLGVGGCYVDTMSPFAVGTAVRVRVFAEGHSFQARAVVTYALTSMGMGLAFSDVSADQVASLHGWVAELNGETMPYSELDSEGAFSVEKRGAKSASLRDVVNEMVGLLQEKHVLTEMEAKDLRQKLSE
jgi:hypothetical protein